MCKTKHNENKEEMLKTQRRMIKKYSISKLLKCAQEKCKINTLTQDSKQAKIQFKKVRKNKKQFSKLAVKTI